MAKDEAAIAARNIASELSTLSVILPSEIERILPFGSSKVDYARFWGKAKEITELFRSSSLRPADRAKLWGKYQELCERAKDLQGRERDEKAAESNRNYSLIRSIISDAKLYASGAKTFHDLRSARASIARAMELMKEQFLFKVDREACWEAWKEANDAVSRRREGICEGNYVTIEKGDLSLIGSLLGRGEPYEAINYIKQAQTKIKELDLTHDQRGWLRESLQRLWDSAIRQIEERKSAKERKHQEWLKRQEEYHRKREQWQQNTEARIGRLNNAIDKSEQYIEQQKDQIDRLESQIDDSSNDNFIDRARGWIEEKYAKIQEAENTIRDIESKISDIRAQLDK